jgi:hypothetical protein
MVNELREKGFSPIVEWDHLCGQAELKEKVQQVICFLEGLEIPVPVKVLDMGALEELVTRGLPVHLSLEHGHCNQRGIRFLCETYGRGGPLKSLSLNHQITLKRLPEFLSIAEENQVDVEVLGMGPLLLFYTPRPLLRGAFDKNVSSVRADSLESPHKGFLLREDGPGHKMYHLKDLYIAPELAQLSSTHPNLVLRFDWQNYTPSQCKALAAHFNTGVFPSLAALTELGLPRRFFKGLFMANKVQGLFGKLRNPNLDKNHHCAQLLGEVLDAQKGQYMALQVQSEEQQLRKGQKIFIRTPEGKELHTHVRSLQNARGENTEKVDSWQVALLPHLKGVSVRSLVFLAPSE